MREKLVDKRVDVRVNDRLYVLIQEDAKSQGLSISAYIRSVLTKKLRK